MDARVHELQGLMAHIALVHATSCVVQQCMRKAGILMTGFALICRRAPCASSNDWFCSHMQESSLCLIKVATSTTGSFQLHSDPLVKSLLASVTHQHSKVRATCLKVCVGCDGVVG